MKLYQAHKDEWFSSILHENKEMMTNSFYYDKEIKEVTLIEGIRNRSKSKDIFSDKCIEIIRSKNDY